MSGGYFDYKEYNIRYIADDLELAIEREKKRKENNEPYCYSQKTIDFMEFLLKRLREDYVYVHRLDYLLEADDGEDDLERRIKQDLEELAKGNDGKTNFIREEEYND